MDSFSYFSRLVRQTRLRFASGPGDVRTRELAAVLREVPEFADFSGVTLRELAEAVHQRTYRAGEFIYYAGDPGLGLYIVESGEVRLVAEHADGQAEELRSLGPFALFGVASLLSESRRAETARAAVETRVLGLFRPDLETLRKRDPQAGLELYRVLARRIALEQTAVAALLIERDGLVAAQRLLHAAPEHPAAQPEPPDPEPYASPPEDLARETRG